MEETNLSSKELKALAKARRPWYMKKRIWALGVIAVAVIASISSAGSDDPEKVGEVAQSGAVDDTSGTTGAESAKKSTYAVGEVLKVDNLEAVVLSTNPSFVDSNDFMRPDEGHKIVGVEFQLKNTGSKSEAISTLIQFALKDASNAQYNVSLYSPEPRFPDGELAAGDTARGWVGFEVPEAASGFRFIFDAKLFGGGQMIWSL